MKMQKAPEGAFCILAEGVGFEVTGDPLIARYGAIVVSKSNRQDSDRNIRMYLRGLVFLYWSYQFSRADLILVNHIG